MTNDKTINEQARKLWQSYFAERQTTRRGSEEFWSNYEKAKDTAKQQQQAWLEQKPSVNSELPPLPASVLKIPNKRQQKYKKHLLRIFVNISSTVAVVLGFLIWFLYISAGKAKNILLDPGMAVIAWFFLTLFVIGAFFWDYPTKWQSKNIRLKFEETHLLVWTNKQHKTRINLAEVYEITFDTQTMWVLYNYERIAIPREVEQFDEVKTYLVAIAQRNTTG